MPESVHPDTDLLAGRVALVTGAAKRIGRAVALRLAGEGADVVIHYNRSKSEAEDAVAEIAKLGRKGVVLQADLCSVQEIKRLFQQTAERFGRLDGRCRGRDLVPGSRQIHDRPSPGSGRWPHSLVYGLWLFYRVTPARSINKHQVNARSQHTR